MNVHATLPFPLLEGEFDSFSDFVRFAVENEREGTLHKILLIAAAKPLIEDGMDPNEVVDQLTEQIKDLSVEEIRATVAEMLFKAFSKFVEDRGGETCFSFDVNGSREIENMRFILIAPEPPEDEESKEVLYI